MEKRLQKAMDLARKTGDRLIVFDNTGSADPYIIMSLEEYERLAVKRSDVRGLTEDELLDKINRDIAVWKSEQEFFSEYLDNGKSEAADSEDKENLEEELEEEFYFEPEQPKGSFYACVAPAEEDFEGREDSSNFSGIGERPEDPESPKKWTIPANRKKAADEVIDEGKGELMEDVGELPY